MNPNVKFPLILLALFAVMLFFSGLYPLSIGLFIAFLCLLIIIIGQKTNYKFGKMWLWGLGIALLLFGAFISLFVMANRSPWLKEILLWPVG